YNHGYLSAYLPQEWVDLVIPFLKSDSFIVN
ncbi:MAG: alpha/beta hydrolase, partial [Streptococcus sp.]